MRKSKRLIQAEAALNLAAVELIETVAEKGPDGPEVEGAEKTLQNVAVAYAAIRNGGAK